MAVCSACGTAVSDSNKFCTVCGQPVAKAAPAPAPVSAFKTCQSCGAVADSSSTFCTICGSRLQEPATTPPPAPAQQSVSSTTAQASAAPAASIAFAPPEPISQPAQQQATVPPPPPTESSYQSTAAYQQPSSGGKFGMLVLILLAVIVGAGFGAWYFRGVETIVVCSPPNVTVFLDDKEVAPTSYGRYVIPHLSRQSHLLKVQSPGFADIVQRLDFPLSSSQEWVNIKLVPSRPQH